MTHYPRPLPTAHCRPGAAKRRPLTTAQLREARLIRGRQLLQRRLELGLRAAQRQVGAQVADDRLELRGERLVGRLHLLLELGAEVPLGIVDRLKVALDRVEAVLDLARRG